jgi:hypothetical protein
VPVKTPLSAIILSVCFALAACGPAQRSGAAQPENGGKPSLDTQGAQPAKTSDAYQVPSSANHPLPPTPGPATSAPSKPTTAPKNPVNNAAKPSAPTATGLTFALPATTVLTAGQKVSIAVSITGPESNLPSAVGFTLSFPSECLSFDAKDVTLEGFGDSGKQPTAVPVQGKKGQIAVIVFGLNNNQIPNNAKVVFSFTCTGSMGPDWTGNISLSEASASTPDAHDITVTTKGGTVSFTE